MPDIVFMDGDGKEIKKSIYEINSIDDIEDAFVELGVIKKGKKNVRKKK
jgi:hypothetical protein